MAQEITSLKKQINWKKVDATLIKWLLVLAGADAFICMMAEGNGTIWLGVFSLFGSGLWYWASMDSKHHDWWYYAQKCFAAIFALFFVVSPFLHIAVKDGVSRVDKVWIVDGETTMSHAVLWRAPFAPFATSINKTQDISLAVSGNMKDGAAVTAMVSGKFQISRDEKAIIAYFGSMGSPDAEVKVRLENILQHSFDLAISSMAVADIATAKNNFAIEHAIATSIAPAVHNLGLVGNGPVVVEYLHPNLKE